jgi:hypothetical protein
VYLKKINQKTRNFLYTHSLFSSPQKNIKNLLLQKFSEPGFIDELKTQGSQEKWYVEQLVKNYCETDEGTTITWKAYLQVILKICAENQSTSTVANMPVWLSITPRTNMILPTDEVTSKKVVHVRVTPHNKFASEKCHCTPKKGTTNTLRVTPSQIANASKATPSKVRYTVAKSPSTEKPITDDPKPTTSKAFKSQLQIKGTTNTQELSSANDSEAVKSSTPIKCTDTPSKKASASKGTPSKVRKTRSISSEKPITDDVPKPTQTNAEISQLKKSSEEKTKKMQYCMKKLQIDMVDSPNKKILTAGTGMTPKRTITPSEKQRLLKSEALKSIERQPFVPQATTQFTFTYSDTPVRIIATELPPSILKRKSMDDNASPTPNVSGI